MRCLFLDVASHHGCLTCVTEKRVIAIRPVDRRIADHELVSFVEEVLREAGWTYGDLTHIACVVGPGGFTSLRVGVSFANALAWVLGIPSAGIHLSDVYGARVRENVSTLNVARFASFLWLHSTKKHECFVRGFGAFAQQWPEPACVALEDFLRRVRAPAPGESPTRWVGELLPEHEDLLRGRDFERMPLEPVDAVLSPFLSSLTYRDLTLCPWYGSGW